MRLRWAGPCRVCDRALSAGERALWDPVSRTLVCAACEGSDAALEGAAGASALREYRRRADARRRKAGARLGWLGLVLARVAPEPQSVRAWRRGATGEVRVAGRLAKHLDGRQVRLLHDRRIPGSGRANIDHIAVGPGGVTVIDAKSYSGKVRVTRSGGAFIPGHPVLRVAGRDRTRLVEGVERQVEHVRRALAAHGEDAVDVRGALCFVDVEGLPLLRRLAVGDVLVDGPRPVAKLARRPGGLDPETIERLWRLLGRSFPAA